MQFNTNYISRLRRVLDWQNETIGLLNYFYSLKHLIYCYISNCSELLVIATKITLNSFEGDTWIQHITLLTTQVV